MPSQGLHADLGVGTHTVVVLMPHSFPVPKVGAGAGGVGENIGPETIWSTLGVLKVILDSWKNSKCVSKADKGQNEVPIWFPTGEV